MTAAQRLASFLYLLLMVLNSRVCVKKKNNKPPVFFKELVAISSTNVPPKEIQRTDSSFHLAPSLFHCFLLSGI